MKNACQPYMTTAARMMAMKILRSMDEITRSDADQREPRGDRGQPQNGRTGGTLRCDGARAMFRGLTRVCVLPGSCSRSTMARSDSSLQTMEKEGTYTSRPARARGRSRRGRRGCERSRSRRARVVA
jgi:hypothetical protein